MRALNKYHDTWLYKLYDTISNYLNDDLANIVLRYMFYN